MPGALSATDIDGVNLIELKKKLFIFFEAKYGDAPMLLGQRLALLRLVDDLRSPAVLFVFRHDVADPMQEVIAADCPVETIYFRNKWVICKSGILLGEYVKRFIKWIDGESNNA